MFLARGPLGTDHTNIANLQAGDGAHEDAGFSHDVGGDVRWSHRDRHGYGHLNDWGEVSSRPCLG